MAVRSGAGTGVIVSLIVFIILTIAMLVMTIVFYSNETKAVESLKQAQDELAAYARADERTSDRFSQYESAATSQRASVAGYLASRYDELASYVNGGASADVSTIKAEFAALGADETGIKRLVQRKNRDVRMLQEETESLERRVQELEQTRSDLEQQIADLEDAHEAEKDEIRGEVTEYSEANEAYLDDLRQTREMMEERVESLRADYEARLAETNRELDAANIGWEQAKDRIDEFERIINQTRIRVQDPALLVDARVLDVNPATGDVFIDKGLEDRIVLGMTFEVYDSASAIRPNADGSLSAGKASIEITNPSRTTSVGRITRSVPGRPVIKNDALANAVYDPTRTFKFLVHGNFDVDRDGRSTAAEAEFIRSRVIDWGGEVVDGDMLPGDLDFLVLGAQPPMPPPLPAQASQAQLDFYLQRRGAFEQYNALAEQARSSSIPILNANRFFLLIGQGLGSEG